MPVCTLIGNSRATITVTTISQPVRLADDMRALAFVAIGEKSFQPTGLRKQKTQATIAVPTGEGKIIPGLKQPLIEQRVYSSVTQPSLALFTFLMYL
jgi:hypothetical protein